MILNVSIGIVILASVLVFFLVIILMLVGGLLYARKKLTPQGEVKLTINDEKELEVNPGSTLLSTLSDQKIYLPSACGGGGTCAMCKCQVLKVEVQSCQPKKGILPEKNNKTIGVWDVR